MNGKSFKGWRWPKIVIWALIILALIAGGIGIYWYTSRDTNPIPSQLRSQLTFSPFVLPSDTKNYSATDYKFSTAEDKVQILSYVLHLGSNSITLSEYPQPTEFTDIPEYKDRFLANVIKQYDVVQTASGTIYLGRAVKQNNKQLAIMIERGLIVFMNPDKELTNTQWRSLGERLDIQKITD